MEKKFKCIKIVNNANNINYAYDGKARRLLYNNEQKYDRPILTMTYDCV
jgi:hypothetical protein